MSGERFASGVAEMHRVLCPGGRLIVVDCFRRQPLERFDADLQLAARLVEKTAAVDGFSVIDDWLRLAASIGFNALETVDESNHVVHNLERLYRLASGFFDDPLLVKTVQQTVPPLLLQNAICGLLMPFTVGGGTHGYYSIALMAGNRPASNPPTRQP